MINKAVTWLFNQSRMNKRLISLALDSLFLSIAFWLAFVLVQDSVKILYSFTHWCLLAITLPLTLYGFIKLGLYRAVLRYLSLQAMLKVCIGGLVSVAIFVISAHFLNVFLPRYVPMIYFELAIIFCGGARIFARELYNQSRKKQKTAVIIYGAGEAGRELSLSLQSSQNYRVIAFIDDNQTLLNTVIRGVKVYSQNSIPWLVERFQATKILLAMPSVARSQRRQIVESLQPFKLEILTIPGLSDIVSGKAKLNELKEVSIEELLGRDPVPPDIHLIGANIKQKVVMITGAGGSIGSELCRQIIRQSPKVLVLYELSEYGLYKIEHDLKTLVDKEKLSIKIIPLLGSVLDKHKLISVMQRLDVETVYHAAAYKHVPLVEYNVIQGLKNNIWGTLNTALCAIESEVKHLVLISTDKAVRPTNIMGASKRLAELVLQGLAKKQSTTCFSMVRFGNVLGSSGSVIPLFKKQILEGGPLTVTHKEITRYFMTLSEAAQLVLQAGAMAKGGEVFVLDMGEPVKIIELAQKMIRLSGFEVKDELNPQGDIEIKITGLRPGEKLYEELLIGSNEQQTSHPRIRCANEVSMPFDELTHLLERLNRACQLEAHALIREILIKAPLCYEPQDDINDLIWHAQKNSFLEAKKAKTNSYSPFSEPQYF